VQLQNISKLFLDQSPRQTWQFLNKRLFNHARLSTFDDHHPCVFVLSTGRTGTETIAALLALAKNVMAFHEPSPKLYEISKLAYENFTDPFAQKILIEVFQAFRDELLTMSLDYGLGYVETSPQLTFLAHAILARYPDARFIHLVRDPRDVVRSGMRRRWFDGHPNDKYRKTPAPSSLAARKWGSFNSFQKILWLWSETNHWISQFLSTVRPQSKLVIHSEDIFNGNLTAIHELFDFIGAPMPPGKKIERLLQKKLNSQKNGVFPASSDWTDEMQRDLSEIAGKVASELGYHFQHQ